MANYYVKVSKGLNGFDYNGTKYSAGSRFENEDACQVLGFLQAAQAANPKSGTSEERAGVRAELEGACSAGTGSTPVAAPGTSPVEANPAKIGGDSAANQGAPDTKIIGTIGRQPGPGEGDANLPPGEEPTRPPGGQPDPAHGGEKTQQPTDAGDPVDIFSGAFFLQEIDLEVPNTIFPLSFVRVYRSGPAAYGPLGWNWDHNYNLYIRELADGTIALCRNLHEDIFKFDGLNFEPPRGIFEKLEPVAALAQVYHVTGDGGTVMGFERPAGWLDAERIPLAWVKDRHNNKLVFSYNTQDKLAEVRDDDARFLRLEYDRCGLLTAVSDQAGREYLYEHDEQTMQLTCVRTPPTTDFPKGIVRIYHYEQSFALPQLRHNITRVEDAEGNIYLENNYAQDPAAWEYARVREQLYGGFLYQFNYIQLQSVPANPIYINLPAVRVEVMNPDFGLETYTFNYRGDLLDRRYRLNKDNSFRVVVWQYEFDAQGNLTITTHPDGSQEIHTYDFANPDPRMRGKLLQKELTAADGFPAPSRIIWKARYEPTYQLVTEEKNEAGATTTYKYDLDLNPGAASNSGRLSQTIHPQVTLPDGTIQGSVTEYEHNNKGQLTAMILPTGTRQEITYGSAGDETSRLTAQTYDVSGLNIENSFKYDAFGYESESIDGNGNSTQKVFNALGLVEKTRLPAINGVRAEYRLHYNSDKKVIGSERPRGEYSDPVLTGDHIIDIVQRDVLGYPTKYLLSSNTVEERAIRSCPDFRGFPVETTAPDGSKLKTLYDERGLLIGQESTGSDGTRLGSKKVYNRAGKLIAETGKSGLTTGYEYDGFSRISTVTLPNNTHLKYKWLKDDLLASEEVIGADGSGVTRQLSFKAYTYDEKGRCVTEAVKVFKDNPAAATNVTTTFIYDKLGRIEKQLDNRGGITIFQYDGLGRLAVEIDPLGNEERHFYDNNGNLVKTSSHHREPDGSVSIISTSYRYDARNRKIQTIEPDGAAFTEKYDDRNLVVGRTDHLGISNETRYNSFNNRVSETQDPGGLAITQRWLLDNMSRVQSYVDPTGEITKYSWDALGRNFKSEYPNGFVSTRLFNNVGQIKEEILSSGVRFEYVYDSANRLSSIKNTLVAAGINPLQPHEFHYDGLGRVVLAKAGPDEITRRYDSTGRLLSEKTYGNELSCSYDDAAGTVEKKWPDGRAERYSHDLNGVITGIEETSGGSLGTGMPLIAAFKSSGSNFLGEAAYPGGLTLVNRYDERKRLVESAVSSPAGAAETIQYRYDKANRKQVEAISGQNPRINYFEFDNKSRLKTARDGFAALVAGALTQAEHDSAISALKIAAAAATHTEEFDYNPADSRTRYAQTAAPPKNYTYLPGHRIQNDGTSNFAYYPAGTLQNDGVFTYEVDALGRVVTIKSGASPVCKIEYDALGRPGIIKEAGKPDKSLNYLGSFVEQENENGLATRQISLHPLTGVPVAYHSALGTHYPLFDNRYNLIGLTNTTGSLLETFRYKSFGVPQIYDAAGNPQAKSAFGVEPVFGGQRNLSSAGLYLSGQRLLNPLNGVYLSADPRGYTDSSSLYVYASQNPVDNIDPTGEVVPLIIAIFVIGGALVGAGYSVYDAAQHPEKYEGAAGVWKPLAQTFGGAAVGGAAGVGGEAALAVGGATGAGATSLTAAETFWVYGTASAVSGSIGRFGFNNMFPEYIDPVSGETVAADFVFGGAVPVAGLALREAAGAVSNGAGEIFSRSANGNWRVFGNNWKLLSKGYSRPPKLEYGAGKLFYNSGGARSAGTYTDEQAFKSISNQYWSQSGGADGKALHHIWFQNQSRWVPRGLRNAGFNLLEIPGPLNTWMGGRLGRELAFRGIITSILAGTGLGSAKITGAILDWLEADNYHAATPGATQGGSHPNEARPIKK